MRIWLFFRSLLTPCLSEYSVHMNVPGWLAATTLATRAPGQENRRCADCSPHPWGSPLRGQRKRCPKLLPAILSSAYPFRLPGRARCNVPVSLALSPHPCGLPQPEVNASAIFSRTQHLALILQLQQLLCRYGFRSNSAGVESPLKPANRRPDDKDWTPRMAARGETRQDVESSRPSVSRTGGERSAQHRFPRGAAGIDKGAAVAPLSRSQVMLVICSAGIG